MKITNTLFLSCLILLLAGCSSSDTSEGVMSPTNNNNNSGDGGSADAPPADVNYQDDIRLIIQNNCISCHNDPPVRNAPMSLLTYFEVVDAVDNRGLLSRINSVSNPMPPGGRMPAATRQIIEDWIDLGLPQ